MFVFEFGGKVGSEVDDGGRREVDEGVAETGLLVVGGLPAACSTSGEGSRSKCW